MTLKSIATVVLAGIMAIGATSCGTQRHVAKKSTNTTYTKPADKHKAPARRTTLARIDVKAAKGNPVTESLLKEADSWIGTPYSWGGNDRNGVDCSGFVLQVYQRSLNIDLPRNSEKQMQFCRRIEREELTPGDLVFFTVSGGNRVGHVGIYIGDGNMVHSSSSKGVIITPLDNPYFVRNYFSSGRVERYYAMIGKPNTSVANKKPATASKPTPKNQATASKPVQKKPTNAREVTLEALTSTSTPLPSQVFASSKTETKPIEAEEPDEEPDYDLFD